MNCPRVHAGVSVAVIRWTAEGDLPQILLMRRQGAHGAGLWSFPGGRLDPEDMPSGNAILTCAEREMQEEIGVTPMINTEKMELVTDVIDGQSWLTIFVSGVLPPTIGEPRIMEPNKCSEMRWFPINAMPPDDQLFHPLRARANPSDGWMKVVLAR